MDFENKYPYTDFHELNLDWILKQMKALAAAWDAYQEQLTGTNGEWPTFKSYIETSWATYQENLTGPNGEWPTFKAAMEQAWNDYQESLTGTNGEWPTFKATMESEWQQFFDNYLQTLGVVQTTGQSATDVMSQKATTDTINGKTYLFTALTDTDDLDNIDINGFYGWGSEVPSNSPTIGGAGLINFTENVGTSYRHYQICTTYDGALYIRRKEGASWGAWRFMAPNPIYQTIEGANQDGCVSQDALSKLRIPYYRGLLTNEDLNTLNRSGYYYGDGESNVTNQPAGEDNKRFTLFSIYVNQYYNFQLFIPYGAPSKIYYRNSSLNWNAWKLFDEGRKPVKITRINADTFRINFGKYYTNIYKWTNAAAHADLWDITQIYANDGTLITNGNIMGVFREKDQANFMGGRDHGNEINATIKIMVDGTEWNYDSTLYGNEIEIDITSDLLRVSDQTHVYDKEMRIRFTENHMNVYNGIKCLVNDSILIYAYNGGMLDCQYPAIKGAVMPNLYEFPAPTATPNNESSDNTYAILYWTNGDVRLNNITGKQLPTFKGWDIVYYTGDPAILERNKIYLDLLGGTETAITADQQIVGEFEFIFN